MDINTLKEYVRLNKKRLSPDAEDCSDPALYKSFADTAHEMRTLNHKVKQFYYETIKNGEGEFRFGDITIVSFLFMSIPLLLAAPGIGESIFGNQAGAAIGYFLTFAIMAVRIFLQAFAPQFRVATAGNFLRITLLVICGYLQIFKQQTFFGTVGIWVFVYIIFGALITLFLRSFDIKRVKEHKAQYNEYSETIEKLDALSAKCEPMYNKLADKADAVMDNFIKTNKLNITPTKRWVWFKFRRETDNHLSGNTATVDFKKPFDEKRDFRESEFDNSDEFYYKDSADAFYKDKNGQRSLKKGGVIAEHRMVWENTYINSQQFGWTDLTGQEAKTLFDKGKIYPYYGMEIPEFLPELKYSFFRHYYDLTIETTEHLTQTVSVECHSKAQDEFLAKASSIESENHYYEATRSNDPHIIQAAAEYEAKKQEIYDSLHGYEEKTIDYPPKTTTKSKKAEEIGGLLIFTPDGELVGAYAADTEQSLELVRNEIKKYTDFVPNIYSQPFGYSQTQAMRKEYFD